MLTRILAGGLLGGFAAGLLAAVLHLLLVQPVLLAAERYESGELVHQSKVAAEHDAVPAGMGSEAAQAPSLAPTLDLRRNGPAALSFGLTYAGFGVLLAAAMTMAATRGHAPFRPRAGLAWGVAGWAAVQLAPALGLPPELPGLAGADLAARQAWWAATAATTALGLAALAFGRGWPALAGGLTLVMSLHVLGAPEPQAFTGPAPPELAALFATRALGVSLVAWLALGWAVAGLRQAAVVEARPHAA